jgi:putative DNA primase/helicase
MPIASTDAFISATGKNLTVVRDLRRRTLLCSLDAEMENPEERKFTQNPLALIQEDRGKFVVAALTIVQAYIAAGRPNPGRPLANYERWSRMVRDPLVWLGLADPVKSQEKTKTEDPDREKHLAVIEGWKRNCGERGHTLGRVIEIAKMTGQDGRLLDEDFHAALIAVAVGKQPGQVDNEKLGKWLRSKKKHPIEQSRFETDIGHNPVWWMLKKVGGEMGKKGIR